MLNLTPKIFAMSDILFLEPSDLSRFLINFGTCMCIVTGNAFLSPLRCQFGPVPSFVHCSPSFPWRRRLCPSESNSPVTKCAKHGKSWFVGIGSFAQYHWIVVHSNLSLTNHAMCSLQGKCFWNCGMILFMTQIPNPSKSSSNSEREIATRNHRLEGQTAWFLRNLLLTREFCLCLLGGETYFHIQRTATLLGEERADTKLRHRKKW